jgi:hypothetical protein
MPVEPSIEKKTPLLKPPHNAYHPEVDETEVSIAETPAHFVRGVRENEQVGSASTIEYSLLKVFVPETKPEVSVFSIKKLTVEPDEAVDLNPVLMNPLLFILVSEAPVILNPGCEKSFCP